MSPIRNLGPTFGREGPELLLNNRERENGQARFLDPPPVGIGVETVISDRDLALVRDMGGDPGGMTDGSQVNLSQSIRSVSLASFPYR